MLKSAAIRTPVPAAVLLAASLGPAFAGRSAAAICDPLMADQRAAFETTVEVQGRDRVSRPLRVPDDADVIVLAREAGIDVTLEVATSNHNVARADSPIRRVGIQRLAFAASRGTEYSVDVAGKEHAGVNGRVELRVVVFTRPAPRDFCLETQRMLAAADSAYAVGQAVTHGTSTDPGVDAPAVYRSAAQKYDAVATRLEAAGPSALLAQAEHAMAAVLYQDTDEIAASESWARKAEATYVAVGDAYGNAKAAAIQAGALMELAVSPPAPGSAQGSGVQQSPAEMFASARKLLGTAAAFHAQRGEFYDQALALNNIGLAYYNEGLNDEAIHAYRRALPAYEKLGDPLRQAQVLQNIAVAEAELGRLTAAIARYSQVLRLITAKEYPKPYAIVLNNSALANWGSGNIDAALGQYGEALELGRALQDSYWQAQSLHGLGSVYDTIGDHDLALDFYRQALALRAASTDGPGRTASLRAIANLLREQGHAGDSLRMDQEALSLASTPTVVDRIRVQIAKDFAALGQQGEAAQQLEAVLSRPGAGNDVERAQALVERARLGRADRDSDAAESDLSGALGVFRQYELPADEFAAWVELARLQRRRGATNEAFASVDRALALVEEVRTQTANPELRATVMQPLRPAFDLKISMLADQYFGGDAGSGKSLDQRVAMRALMTAEQARARALADFRKLDESASELTQQQLEQRQTLYRELASRRFQLENRLAGYGAADARVALLRGEIATLRQQLDRINVAMTGTSASGKPRADNKAGGGPIDLRTVPTDTALVEYWLGADEAYAWVLTREQLIMRRIGPTAEVNDDARAFHTALRSFGSVSAAERLRLGERLYGMVVQPLAAFLSDKHTLWDPLESTCRHASLSIL